MDFKETIETEWIVGAETERVRKKEATGQKSNTSVGKLPGLVLYFSSVTLRAVRCGLVSCSVRSTSTPSGRVERHRNTVSQWRPIKTPT